MEVIDTVDQIIDEIVDTVVSAYKECTKCGITKLKKCFTKDKKTKDGLYYCCKDCVKAHSAKRYQENRDEILAQKAEYDAKPENKAKKAEYRAKPETKAKKTEYNAAYNSKPENKVKRAEHRAKPEKKTKRNARERKRRETDEGFRIANNLRTRLWLAVGGTKKSASTMKLVGLESGTAINDYLNMKSPWFKEQSVPSEELVTDHMIPCSKYDLTNPDHQKACFHYINLQFLTMPDNNKKKDKVPEGFNFESTLKRQLDLIARIEKDKLTYQQVLEMQNAGDLYEVKGYEV